MRTALKGVAVLCAAVILISMLGIFAFAAYENTYKNTGNPAADIVGVAKTQVGYTESSNGSTKYGAFFDEPKMDWCAAFIVWCADQAGIPTSVIPKNASSTGLKNFYNQRGLYHVSQGHGGSYTPKPGDIAIVSRTSDPNNITHVGLVAWYSDGRIGTVEGNYGDKVAEVTYTSSATKIVGFASPAYGYENGSGYYRLNSAMRLRSEPSTQNDDSILLLIPEDTVVRVTSVSGDWGYTSYSGIAGWMNLAYSTYQGPLDGGGTELPVPKDALFLVADVSKFNDPYSIDWAQMKEAGVKGVIMRVGGRGYGSEKQLYSDTAFAAHYRRAKAAGMSVGVYFFSYALNTAQAKEEAEMTLRILRENNCELDMPVFIDIEDYAESDHEDRQHQNAGKAVCSLVVNTFCDTVADAGYYPGVYCNKFFAETLLDSAVFAGRAVWIAHYGVSQCGYSGRYDLWQYTSTGRVSGYSGKIDLSYCYVDYPALIANGAVGSFGTHKAKAGWTVTKQATCTAEGTRIRTCEDCGITLISETVQPTDHRASEDYILLKNNTVMPGDTMTDQLLSTMHGESGDNYKEVYLPTYTENGGTMITYCLDCGKVLTVSYSYGEIEHARTKVSTVPATCAKEGVLTTDCQDCGKTLSRILIPRASHTEGKTELSQRSCITAGTRTTYCGVCQKEIRTEYVAPTDHLFGPATVQTPVTLRSNGVEKSICTVCGTEKTESILSPRYGDIDGDGKITSSDARLALRAAVQLDTLNYVQNVAGDINHSGSIDSADARYILRFTVDLDDPDSVMNKYY